MNTIKKPSRYPRTLTFTLSLLLALGLFLQARHQPRSADSSHASGASSNRLAATSSLNPSLPPGSKLVLVPHSGDTPLDRQIIKAQQAVTAGRSPAVSLERLGWLFVAKARASFDPGFYKLAEQCALCLEGQTPGDASGMLLRGHVLQNLHRFKDAEPIARQLVATRGAPFDYGLLGDVLTDLGQVDDAIAAYQSMMDLRPDSQAYARAAHVRWLKGDLRGAVAAIQDAVRSVGLRNAEAAAWMNTRLAFYEWQSGETARAEAACATALGCASNYAPALLLHGRMQLASGQPAEAVETLRRAVAINPLPEHQWLLAESLRAAKLTDEAGVVEKELTARGVADDPRTVALFLGTRGEQTRLALSLAERELKSRGDVFTHDALAWALSANGRHADAWQSIERALAEGTRDARLFLHAGVIAVRLNRADADDWLARARQLQHLLLPSEQQHLADAAQFKTASRSTATGSYTAVP